MNLDNSWMGNYGSKLRKREENFNYMHFESSKLTVENHEYGSLDSNNAETKVKPSSMHRETVASTKRENPGLLESSSGGSSNSTSNPFRLHPRKKSIFQKKSIERTQFGTTISGWQMWRRRHSIDTLTMVNPRGRVCTHSFDKKVLGRCHTNWEESYLQYGEEDWKEFLCKDWLHCFHRRRFKTRIEICKNADKEVSGIRLIRRHSAETIIPSRLTNYVMFHHKGSDTHGRVCHTKKKWHTKREYTLSLCRRRIHVLCCRMWVKHEINIPLQKLNWLQKEKNVMNKIMQNLLHQQRCRQSRSNYRSKETEGGDLSNAFCSDSYWRVLNSLVRYARTNFDRQRLRHHHVPVYAERMRRKSCQ